MKKILLATVLCALSHVALAQPQSPHTPPPPARYTVSFESRHGEAFTVFIDGDVVNRMPQSRVMVNDISDKTHEVVVVLKRPAEKAAVLSLRPGEPNVTVNVNYDTRLEQLYLFTPGHNRAEPGGQRSEERPQSPKPRPQNPDLNTPTTDQQPPTDYTPPTEEDVQSMVQRLNGMSFDSDRLALGKAIVAGTPMLASQIAKLAAAIDFSNSQVDFLKYAYAYCVDKENYYNTVNVLTFSSDKKKVLDYIATQQ